MKSMKRTLSLLLAVLMLLSLLPPLHLPARADDKTDLTIDFGYSAIAQTSYQGRAVQGIADNKEYPNKSEDYYKSSSNKFKWVHVYDDSYSISREITHSHEYYYKPVVPPTTTSGDDYSLRYYLQSTRDDHTYISLQDDFDMSMIEVDPWETIEITKDKVLDLNGHALYVRYDGNLRNDHKGPTTNAKYHKATMIEIKKGATLTIIDSSRWRGANGGKGTGKISFTAYMCDPFSYDVQYYTTRDLFAVNGNLVIYGGTFQAGRQKDQLKSKFSWKKLKTIIGSAVSLGSSVLEYATGISAAAAVKKDLNESFMDEAVPDGDNGGKDDPSTSTIKRTGSGGYQEKKKDTPGQEGNANTGAGRNETVDEKKASKNKDIDEGNRTGTKEGENKADDKKPGKNDKNTKLAEAEKNVAKSIVNESGIESMVNSTFKLVDDIVDSVGRDEKSRVTNCIQGTVARVGNTGTMVVYDGTFKGYGSTPNTRNAVIEVVKQETMNPSVPGKYNGGQVYVFGGTFEGNCGANIFNMIKANNSQRVVQYERDTDGVVVPKTVTLSEQETMGYQQIYYENASAVAANDSVTPIPVNTGNVVVRGGTFRNYFEVMMVAAKSDGDSGHFSKFPGTPGSVNLGIESYGEDLIRDGRIQIVDKYVDGAMVLMDERTEDGDVSHYRLFCGDTELRYKTYLEVCPNTTTTNSTHTLKLDTYYGDNAKHLMSEAWGSDKESERNAAFANDEKFIDFPIDARNSESYYMIPELTDTDVYGQKLDASSVWYYPVPLDYDGKMIQSPAWGDVRYTAPGKSGAQSTVTASQMTDSESAWADGLKKADKSKAVYTAYESKSLHTNFKWFEYKIYKVDPLTRENIGLLGYFGVDYPLAKVVYGTSGDSLKCKLPLKDLERQIKKNIDPDWVGYRPGEMYRVVLTVEEHFASGYIGNGSFRNALPVAKAQTSLCFRCVGIEEDDPDGDPNAPDYTVLQWTKQPTVLGNDQYATVELVNAKTGQVDFRADKIFDVYYQWWEVEDDGTPIRIIAGTDNVYEDSSMVNKEYHIPERWNLSDGHTYANTRSLPANPRDWTPWDIHMYTQEMCRDEGGMRLYQDQNLSLDNNYPFFGNSDSCYLPEYLAGKNIRVKAIAINLKWPKNFDKKQVFWSHIFKLPGEATKPLLGDVDLKFASGVSFASIQHPLTLGAANVGGLSSDEYITSVTYTVNGRQAKAEGLKITDVSKIPTKKYPQDFYSAKELENPSPKDISARVSYVTNKGRTYYSSYQKARFEVEAERVFFSSGYSETKFTAESVRTGKYAEGIHLFWPEPYNASVGYSLAGTSSNPKVATLDDRGWVYFTGNSGETTLTVKNVDGTPVRFVLRVVEEYTHFEVTGVKAPVYGEPLVCSANVPSDAPYHVKQVYWTAGDDETPLGAGTRAEYMKRYTAHVVVEDNDCCSFSDWWSTCLLSWQRTDGAIVSDMYEYPRSLWERPFTVNGDGTCTFHFPYSAIPDHISQKVDTIYIDFPTEVTEGTNVSEWMKQVHVYANGYDTGVEAELMPTYGPRAQDVMDVYCGFDQDPDYLEFNSFVPGIQTGLSGKIVLDPAYGDTYSGGEFNLVINGKPGGTIETSYDTTVYFRAENTLTVTDGKPVPEMPDYAVKRFNLIAGKDITMADLLVCDDPRVSIELEVVRIPDWAIIKLEDYMTWDTGSGVLHPFQAESEESVYVGYFVNYDHDGDGIPEYHIHDFQSAYDGILASSAGVPPIGEIDTSPDPARVLDPAGKTFFEGTYSHRRDLTLPEDTLISWSETVNGTSIFHTAPASAVQIHPGATELYAWLPLEDGTDARLQISVDDQHYTYSDRLIGLTPDTDYLLYVRSYTGGPTSVLPFHTAKTDYSVYVGRTPVTDQTLGSLEGDHWHYDPATNVLTLKDLELKDKGAYYHDQFLRYTSWGERGTIAASGALTLELLGQNHVVSSGSLLDAFIAAENDLTIIGTGNLLLTPNKDKSSVDGIRSSNGDLILNGSGTLTFDRLLYGFQTKHDFQYRNGTIDYIPYVEDGVQHGRLMGADLRENASTRFKTDGAIHTLTFQLAGANGVYRTVTKQEMIDSFTDYGGDLAIRMTVAHSDTQKVEKADYYKSGDCESGCVYYYSCACGHIGTSTFTAAAGSHSLETVPAGPVTCVAPTWDAYQVCTKCGWNDYAQHRRLGTGHEWIHHEGQAPTCTADGWPSYDICARCGLSSEQDVQGEKSLDSWKATGHDMTYIAGRTAGCTVSGCITHFSCAACGKLFLEASGTTELTEDEVYNAPPLGHNYMDGVCTRCGAGESPPVDTDKLNKAVNDAEKIDPTQYTGESYAALEAALAEAKAVQADPEATQAQVDAAVAAVSAAIAGLKEKGGDTSNPFVDVKSGAFYYDPVLWAVEHDPQITKGTDANHFSPDATCTRGQVVTFLWRAAGCPEPSGGTNPFKDVKDGAFYYNAVLWAVEMNITKGTGATTFSPDQGCTRGQVVTFLHRFAGTPESDGSENPFGDVKEGAFYYKAVLWAVEKNITKGLSATSFGPDNTCTRGQIVTFLYRATS